MKLFRKTFKKNNFNSFVKNKSIALVGPANYLNHFRFGQIIDNYDYTARINRGMELVENNRLSIGSKTDILFNCLIEHNDNGGKISLTKLKQNDVKWLCTIPYSDFNGNVNSNKLNPQVNFITKMKLKYFFNLHIHDYKNYKELNRKINCRANTGFSAIFDLLENGAKKIYVCGYSFYLDSFMQGYKMGCEKDEEKFAEDCFNSVRHNQLNQWKYLKEIRKDKRLIFDPILEEILNLKELDRKEFPRILDDIKNK